MLVELGVGHREKQTHVYGKASYHTEETGARRHEEKNELSTLGLVLCFRASAVQPPLRFHQRTKFETKFKARLSARRVVVPEIVVHCYSLPVPKLGRSFALLCHKTADGATDPRVRRVAGGSRQACHRPRLLQ